MAEPEHKGGDEPLEKYREWTERHKPVTIRG